MANMKTKRPYNSINVQYKGCFYHSLLELKFILLIENKCSWIREPVAIHYNPDTLEVTNYINEKTRKYIPDFLVRKWNDNTGYLIEIKPQEFLDSEEMQLRNKITKDYLMIKNVDWKFKVLTEKDIILNEKQKALFQKVVDENKNIKSRLAWIELDKKYNNSPQKYFRSIPYLNSNDISDEDYILYVRYGIIPTSKGEQEILLESNAIYETKHEKESHLEYLKTKFNVNCSREIFNLVEIDLLENYGAWMEALYLCKINPITERQNDFIKQVETGNVSENEYAKVWFKYIKRIEIERKYGDRLKIRYEINDNDFYRREDYYKLHKDKIRRI